MCQARLCVCMYGKGEENNQTEEHTGEGTKRKASSSSSSTSLGWEETGRATLQRRDWGIGKAREGQEESVK